MITDNTYARWEAPPDPEPKPKFPRALAMSAAAELVREIRPYCERIIVAGSLRRRKPMVGDIEMVYVPMMVEGKKSDLFKEPELVDAVAVRLEYLIEERKSISRRLNKEGRESWGPKNKLAVHLESGVPVDFFATTESAWWNYLVCRTGPAESNIRICQAAEARGWKWKPYAAGFELEDGKIFPMMSEREVFEFVGLKYREPWER